MFFYFLKLCTCLDERNILSQSINVSYEIFEMPSKLDNLIKNLKNPNEKLQEHSNSNNKEMIVKLTDEFCKIEKKIITIMSPLSNLHQLNNQLLFIENILQPGRVKLSEEFLELNKIVSEIISIRENIQKSHDIIIKEYNSLVDSINTPKKNRKSIANTISVINSYVKSCEMLSNQIKLFETQHKKLKTSLLPDGDKSKITKLTYKQGSKWHHSDIDSHSLLNDKSIKTEDLIKAVTFFEKITKKSANDTNITVHSYLNMSSKEISLIKDEFKRIKFYNAFFKNSIKEFVDQKLRRFKDGIIFFNESLEYKLLNLESTIKELHKEYKEKIEKVKKHNQIF